MIDWTEFAIGDHRIACPVCARKRSDKTMGVTVRGEGDGVARCFRCNYIETRQEERELTQEERKAFARRMEALRRQHDAEQRQRQAEAAAMAALRWAAAVPAVAHPYLTAKTVKAHGLRLGDWPTKDRLTGEPVTLRSVLYVPMRDSSGVLRSLQGITERGEKLFLSGGRVKGCYHSIGRPSGRLLIAEGYATGATLHEATGDAVAVAFNAGNLMAVAQALRSKFPCLSLVLAADDDHETRDPRSGELTNPGVTAARAAALKVGGKVAVPDFSGLARTPKDTDFNDLMRLAGALKIGGAE
jgi:putative DNA primase/helicase